jgi:predicted acetyltransferase
MTEIRRLKPEDIPQLNRMHTVVYNLRKDYSEEEEQKEDPLDHPAHWTWGVFDNGKLLSGMHELDFLMRFDGHSVRMSGIGGVGTLPEARKGGHIRRIFEQLLPEAYEKGVIFSSLTPFSHDFYRLFGYEIACARNNITIPSKDFLRIKPHGQFVPVFPGDDTQALQGVHAAYIAGLNQGICRDYWPDNRGWKRFTQDDPYATGTFIYLWKDDQGKPQSYIKYQDKEEDDGHIMSVLELAFIDREGLYGALGLVGGLSAQFEKFRWLMPTFIDPCDFLGEAWDIEQEFKPRDMTRIINVKAALEMMRRPSGEGGYVVETEDPHITANNRKYLVEFAHEGTRVTPTQKESDLRCDIRVLSQLVTGYRTLENALYSRQSGLELCGNRETLSRVFTQRPQHITEYF